MIVKKITEATPYSSHRINYGSPGMGKSTQNKKWMEWFFAEMGFKCVDLYDEFRLENAFYALPSPEPFRYDNFIKVICSWYRCTPDFAREAFPWKSRAFPCELLFPALRGRDLKVPAFFKPFRISYSALSSHEFKILLGRLSPDQEGIISDLRRSCKSLSTFVAKLVSKDFSRASLQYCAKQDYIDLVKRIDNLLRDGFVCDDEDPLALDLTKILRDTETITSFSMFNVEDQNLMFLIYGVILKGIWETKKREVNRYNPFPETVINIRELQDIAAARGQAAMFAYEGQGIVSKVLLDIQRKPRDIKIRLYCDSQNPASISKPVRSAFGTTGLFQLDIVQLRAITELIYLDPKTELGVQTARVGVSAVKVKPGEVFDGDRTGVHYPMIHLPPESWPKAPDDSFFIEWRKAGGSFVDLRAAYPSIYEKRGSIIPVELFREEVPDGSGDVSISQSKVYYSNWMLIQGALGSRKVFRASDIVKLPFILTNKINRQYFTVDKVQKVLEAARRDKIISYDARKRVFKVRK